MEVNNQSKTLDRDQQNKNTQNYTFWGNCSPHIPCLTKSYQSGIKQNFHQKHS